jgi:AcrR family transcriptional regulator
LIEIACDVLKSKPPSDITRASVAREANVDPGLIRYYFQNRDSLMRMAAETLTQRLQARGAAAAGQPGLSGFEKISERVRALLAFKVENPFYHRLMMEEMAPSQDPESRALFMGIAGAAIERYRKYLEEGANEGEIRQVNPALLYIAIIGLCDYYVIAAPALAPFVGETNQDKLMQIYGEFICDLLLNGLKNPEAK